MPASLASLRPLRRRCDAGVAAISAASLRSRPLRRGVAAISAASLRYGVAAIRHRCDTASLRSRRRHRGAAIRRRCDLRLRSPLDLLPGVATTGRGIAASRLRTTHAASPRSLQRPASRLRSLKHRCDLSPRRRCAGGGDRPRRRREPSSVDARISAIAASCRDQLMMDAPRGPLLVVAPDVLDALEFVLAQVTWLLHLLAAVVGERLQRESRATHAQAVYADGAILKSRESKFFERSQKTSCQSRRRPWARATIVVAAWGFHPQRTAAKPRGCPKR